MNGEKAVVALGIVVSAAQVYSQVNPSIFTIRHFGGQEGVVRDVRTGELIGTLYVSILGVILSGMLDDDWPIGFAAATAGVSVGIYEWALATRRVKTDAGATEAAS